MKRTVSRRCSENGQALEKFKMFVTAQGGDVKICDDYSLLPNCPFVETYKAKESGYITGECPFNRKSWY